MALLQVLDDTQPLEERSGIAVIRSGPRVKSVDLLLVCVMPWRRVFMTDFGRRAVVANPMAWLRISFERGRGFGLFRGYGASSRGRAPAEHCHG